MTIRHLIDHEKRLVVAWPEGVVQDHEVFAFQEEVWSRPDVSGYDELVDMTAVTDVRMPSGDRARQLASFAASTDPKQPSKLAIIAASDLAYGLGRLYQTYRSMDPRSTRQVGVFRTPAEALAFLGLDEVPARPQAPQPPAS